MLWVSFHRIDVFAVTNITNMKNNFVATFILLAVGLIFNDVASVHGQPTKLDRRTQQQLQQISIEATDAVYRCRGTFSNYKEPQQCNKARVIKDVMHKYCFTANSVPIACDIFSSMSQAEMNANRDESVDNAMRAIGGGPSLGGGPVDNAMRSLGD